MKTAYGYIRLSSTKQLKGSGEERQSNSKKLDDICSANGWRASEQTFKDLGVSAWKGKNRLQGNLAAFISLLKEGRLSPEPVLVVEAFDRISIIDAPKSRDAINEILLTIMEFNGNPDGSDKITKQYLKYSQKLIADSLKDNSIRQKIRNELPNSISKIIFNTAKKTYQVFNHLGKLDFESEPMDADIVWKQVVKLSHHPKHKKAMKGMNPANIKIYTAKLEREIRGQI